MNWPSNNAQVDEAPVSDAQWGDWQRRFGDSDRAAGFDIGRDFQPFNQMNDMFTRAMWDPDVRTPDTDAFFASYRMEATPRRGEGFSQRDFALRNASWIVSDIISGRGSAKGMREGFQGAIESDTPVADVQVDLAAPDVEAMEIKRIAKLFGADILASPKLTNAGIIHTALTRAICRRSTTNCPTGWAM